MKIQNIVAALLVIIASQGLHAVDNRIYNALGDDKGVRFTVIYKNGKKETRELKPLSVVDGNIKGRISSVLIVTTKANPIKKILFNRIGSNDHWLVSLDSVKDIDEQEIGLLDDELYLFSMRGLITVEDKQIQAERVVDEV